MRQQKLEYQQLNDRTYASLKGGLISGMFQPGQVLVIRTVAASYGISPTPVREALQRLVAERLLTMQANRSIIVPPLSIDKFSELYRIRCALEGLAGELATEHFRPTDLVRIGKTVEAMDESIARSDGIAYRKMNEKFHFVIYEKASSPRLFEMIQNLWCQVGPFLYGLFEDGVYRPHANDHHQKVLRALEKKNGALVREAIVADITAAARSLMPQLKSLVVQEQGTAPSKLLAQHKHKRIGKSGISVAPPVPEIKQQESGLRSRARKAVGA
jgi:DNA-binding GntR family transcriptional regulator